MRICVYGAASDNLAQQYYEQAHAFGKALAEAGIGLVYGGGGGGIMGALARGAAEANGEIIGVSPRFFRADGVLYEGCTQMIYTEDMRSRKARMEELSDGFVMLPGGIGTFDEFFEIITLRSLKQHDKRIGVLNTAGYFDSLLAFLEESTAKGFMREGLKELYFVSEEMAEVLAYVMGA